MQFSAKPRNCNPVESEAGFLAKSLYSCCSPSAVFVLSLMPGISPLNLHQRCSVACASEAEEGCEEFLGSDGVPDYVKLYLLNTV